MSRKMETPSDGELHRHARLGNVGQLKRILDSGKVHVDCVNLDGISPLMWASGNGHLAAVQILLNEGARINLRKPDGVTALIFASQGGHRDAVDLLINNGAEVNAQTSEGGSALLAAAQNGHVAVVQSLLKCGADTRQTLEDGANAMFLAAQNGHVRVVKALLEATVDDCEIGRTRTDGISPFWIACQMGHGSVIEELLTRKQRDLARPDGATGLFKASHKGADGVVRLLVHDSDPRTALGILKNGESALHAAALFGHPQVVDILLKAGADSRLKNQHDNTPADLADQMKYDHIVDMLRPRRLNGRRT